VATTYPVLLNGGPCDGRTLHLTADQLQLGRPVCKGTVYVQDPVAIPWYPPRKGLLYEAVTESAAGRIRAGVPVLLVGGPCNGETRRLRLRVAQAGRLTCHGATYVPDPRDTNWPPKVPYTTERWIPNWQAAAIVSGHPPRPARNVAGAWRRLMHAFSRTAPQEIRRLRKATARMDRLAYKLRRL
jgi:hypothetical protein